MEESLKLILNKLDKIESKITHLEEGQIRLEKKIDDNLDLVLEEQSRIYNSLDGKLDKVIEKLDSHEIRISALETRV